MYLTIARFLASVKNEIHTNDIFIVDGGKQQINEALYALKEAGLDIPVFGLVKNNLHKTDYLINSQFEKIKVSTQLLNLFAQMQVEVDRFAKSFMRKKHLVSSLESKLSQIKGIGSKTEKLLLNHFGTYTKIYNASYEEIEKVTNKKIAKLITDAFKEEE
ncbi:excinuclease ABC subunit C [Mycoplasmopsis gallopavonis]|uniref:Excinuclease ABC subunit C n=2 Tax=Mycoplasmopsis gallopavonis TaxID=76629 RepID=A0A449AZD9_9BACT|nr:excinuclease ABC subunit C [Mycoplasmopsis gallopavonis]